PLVYGKDTATTLLYRAVVDSNPQFYYEIHSENKVVETGNAPITKEQYDNWGTDDTYIENVLLTHLQIERQ
ncbi:MAG: hypothetical protein ACRCS4_04150, partial [Flavobacterium sp.]